MGTPTTSSVAPTGGGSTDAQAKPTRDPTCMPEGIAPISATVCSTEVAAVYTARIRELEYANKCLEERLSMVQRDEAKAQMYANYDELTGLPNRRLLKDRLEQALLQAARQTRPVALILLDLDDFKGVNDSLGHRVGDQVLRVAAKRISSGTRGGDTACRYGGDEFVIMLVEFNDIRTVDDVVGKVQAKLSKPYLVRGVTIRMSASVGRVIYPDDGDCLETLIEKADNALYSAKADRVPTLITDLHPEPVPKRITRNRTLHLATDHPGN
jgi:diguanylate cyclase (GGDEF)-like protein